MKEKQDVQFDLLFEEDEMRMNIRSTDDVYVINYCV